MMEHMGTVTHGLHPISHTGGLPDDPAHWPEDARSAYREVLRELDGWSRQHNAPASTNSWVAEEAVRQTW